jgi:3-carboxy-cis,cis-muconate cycloisomerase
VAATGRPLADLLGENAEIAQCLDRATIVQVTDPASYLGAAGDMIDRVLARHDSGTG